MPGWTLSDAQPTQGRTFHRPLDVLEVCYFWHGLFDGAGDSLYYYELRLANGLPDAHLFSKGNIEKAWLSTKRRFPLSGAIVYTADGAPLQFDPDSVLTADSNANSDVGAGFTSEPHFLVREHDLSILRPGEIVFGRVTNAKEAQQQAAAIAYGSRQLSAELLVRLYVFRETDSDLEKADVLHMMVLVAHCLTDGTASRTLARCFMDTLARGGEPEVAQIPLEERLAMAIPPGDLEPVWLRALSPAIRRWRRAVGIVIFRLRMAKMQGGHTLPCRLTRSMPNSPAQPGLVSTSLTPAETAAVLANCRLYDLTFGNAFLVLTQVAMTRVLYRCYLRGEISEEEWAYRKRQPHINGGPLNLRRYLDEAWFDKGGGGEFMLCISLFIYQLPFMTLGATTHSEGHLRVLADGAPPFSDLLTFERFLHRAESIKRQAKAFFSHPLFLELVHAAHLDYLQYTRHRTLRWLQHGGADDHGAHVNSDEDEMLAVTEIPLIWAHGGSSLGNIDLMSPAEYPLPHAHPLSPYSPFPHPLKTGYIMPSVLLLSDSKTQNDTTLRIIVESTRVHLHTRPAELFLGAATSHGQMTIYVHYDGNVFEEGVVQEWLDEVREAVVWYLC